MGLVIKRKYSRKTFMNPTLFEDDFEEPVIRKSRIAEPVTKYDYCKIMSSITKRPIGLFLKETQFWPMDWIYSIASECKLKKTEVDKAKYINWFLKQARVK